MKTYEITIERPNGDWSYWRAEYPDFQVACEAGLVKDPSQGRLLRVERIDRDDDVNRS